MPVTTATLATRDRARTSDSTLPGMNQLRGQFWQRETPSYAVGLREAQGMRRAYTASSSTTTTTAADAQFSLTRTPKRIANGTTPKGILPPAGPGHEHAHVTSEQPGKGFDYRIGDQEQGTRSLPATDTQEGKSLRHTSSSR
ncbi:hypothetical protein LSAT2_015910 [Lamellibrachia satsuma]|nr:hypothetical protein LSAT2_015910 [Lamellibrachia satsuma]